MDSDSDKEKYYVSDTEDEEKPRPTSRHSSISQPPSPVFPASSSADENEVDIVASQQPQPSQWTVHPEPRSRVVHTFIGDRNGKKQWRCTHNERDHSTLRYATILRENYFTGCGDESLLPPVPRQFWRQTFSPTWGDKRKCLSGRKVEGFGHKLYVDNFFSSPDLFDELAQKKISCCGTLRLHIKGTPKDLKPRHSDCNVVTFE